VVAEEWLDKKGAWDNSYEATFGQDGWGFKAQQVLGQVSACGAGASSGRGQGHRLAGGCKGWRRLGGRIRGPAQPVLLGPWLMLAPAARPAALSGAAWGRGGPPQLLCRHVTRQPQALTPALQPCAAPLKWRRSETTAHAPPGAHAAPGRPRALQTRGKGFRHEKTKKKRGSYRGGKIDTNATFSIKFEE
jgi:hypothetical protein